LASAGPAVATGLAGTEFVHSAVLDVLWSASTAAITACRSTVAPLAAVCVAVVEVAVCVGFFWVVEPHPASSSPASRATLRVVRGRVMV
jgi:hypothetical protein